MQIFSIARKIGTIMKRTHRYYLSFSSDTQQSNTSERERNRHRTSQRLCDRVKQHVPSSIRNKTVPQREQPSRASKPKSSLKHDSAIGQHLLDNPECAKAYSENCFRIIGRARSTFHLAILESVYIKTRDPLLCRQKEFVFALGLLK